MISEFRFLSISWIWINGFWPNIAHSSANFANALILITSNLGLWRVHFCPFITELWPLNDVKNEFPLNVLRTKKWIFTKFCKCIDIDNICMELLSIHFRQLLQSYGPWMTSEFSFRSLCWEWRNGFSPNFANALILTTYNLGLLSFLFHLFIFIPRHTKSGGVLCYTLRTLSVHLSVCQSSIWKSACLSLCLSISASFQCSNFSTIWPIFFKLCIDIGVGEEWYGIASGLISFSNNRVMALDVVQKCFVLRFRALT